MHNKISSNSINEHLSILNSEKGYLIKKISEISSIVSKAILNGNKIIFFGNGGSAADAQHLAAELSGRYVKERKALPGLALTTDTSALTAIGNDYGFDFIFERQIEALSNKGDILIAISTSGNSTNVINAVNKGRELGCYSIGFLGKDGGKMKKLCDNSIIINSNITARIQEIHILLGHIICESVDSNF